MVVEGHAGEHGVDVAMVSPPLEGVLDILAWGGEVPLKFSVDAVIAEARVL